MGKSVRSLLAVTTLLSGLATLAAGGCGSDDTGGCDYPTTQTLSQPCCADYGVDACGADLFCAALDGREQATCYPLNSRDDSEECTASNQCLSALCIPAGFCAISPFMPCHPGDACGPGPMGGDTYICDPDADECRSCAFKQLPGCPP